MKAALAAAVVVWIASGMEAVASEPWNAFSTGQFAWKCSPPLLAAAPGAADPEVAVKDPTIVRYEGRWHVFCTVRTAGGKVDTQYLSFEDWPGAATARKTPLGLHDQYYCAPQVFFFRPHKKWYLVFQIRDKNHDPPWGPACSTNDDISNPRGWSKPHWLFTKQYKGLDYWAISDGRNMHLFFTSLDGRMWRSWTKMEDFPGGWSEPQVVLQADIFEASHTYRLKGMDRFLTIVEAQGGGGRYYKAYIADSLDGRWKPLADSIRKPFAGMANVRCESRWTDNISHGELIRSGCDEMMEVDPSDVKFLFQGASSREYGGSGGYGKIPWRLGLLEMDRP